MNIVVIEDDPKISVSIMATLSTRWPGATVRAATTAKEGLELVQADPPDLLMLDLTLPDRDGLEVLREVHLSTDAAVIIVSGRAEEPMRVKGLQMGADDYVLKPFSATELLARVEAVMRRCGKAVLAGPAGQEDLPAGHGVQIDARTRRVFLDGNEVQLTPVEWALLRYMVENEGRVVTNEELAERVWGVEYLDPEAIKVYVGRLRAKLNDDPEAPRLVRSHGDTGYVLALSQ